MIKVFIIGLTRLTILLFIVMIMQMCYPCKQSNCLYQLKIFKQFAVSY